MTAFNKAFLFTGSSVVERSSALHIWNVRLPPSAFESRRRLFYSFSLGTSTLLFFAGHVRKCRDLEKIVLNQKRTLDSTRFEHKDLKWSKDCNINVCNCNCNWLNTQISTSSRCQHLLVIKLVADAHKLIVKSRN